jgi:septum formation protein
VVKPDTEENLYKELTPAQSVMYLAFKKAMAVLPDFPGETILAADTIVYKDEIIGKPEDEADAARILKKLRNTSHEVLTGVAVFQAGSGKKHIFYDRSLVYFKDYSDECIRQYIKTEHIWDKAGGYALQEAAGELFVERVEGDTDNVIGLPWYRVSCLL